MASFFRLGVDNLLRAGTHSVQLTPTEARAMAHLLDHAGQVVSRRVMEKEVWGFKEGVRSEAVPVALRGLRAKLGPHRDRMQTLRGVGWRLNDEIGSTALPEFSTPFHPRAAAMEQIGELFDSGWSVVTLVGPGGAGKTRLAVEYTRALTPGAAWIPVGAAREPADVIRALQAGLGVVAGGVDELASALVQAPRRVVVDEAEACTEAVREVLAKLPGEFLVTSRRQLGLASEATVALGGLSETEGLLFLEKRLAASRWAVETSPETRRAVVNALDGLPLALEFAAVHPLGLEDLVEGLDRGAVPRTSDSRAWIEALERSVDALSSPLLRVLLGLCACEVALSEDELARWMGPDAVGHARELASRSLSSRDGARWRVLRTVRAFLSDHPERSTAGRELDEWLVRRCAELDAELVVDPARALSSWAVLAAPMLSALHRVPPDRVERMASQLFRLYGTIGPMAAQAEVLSVARQRRPMSLLLRVLAVPHTGDDSAITEAEATGEPGLRFHALEARARVLPATLDRDALGSLAPDLEPPRRLQVQARHLGVEILRRPLEEARPLLEQLAALVEAIRPYPLLWNREVLALGIALHWCRYPAHAVAVLDDGIESAREAGLVVNSLFARRMREIARVHLPDGQTTDGLLLITADLEAAGLRMQARDCLGYAALVEFSQGRRDRAASMLETAGGSPSMKALCRIMRLCLESSDGDAEARHTLEATSPEVLLEAGEHDRFAHFSVAYFQWWASCSSGASADERVGLIKAMLADPRLAITGASSPDCVLLRDGLVRQAAV